MSVKFGMCLFKEGNKHVWRALFFGVGCGDNPINHLDTSGMEVYFI